MFKPLVRLALFVAAGVISLTALAGGATVTEPWLRYIPGGAPSAGYFRLTNEGDRPISLVGAECGDFGRVMMHRTIERGGISTMRPVHEITIAPGKSVAFEPGGYHLMLMRPKHPLRPGGRLPVTLRFSDGSTLSAEFLVKSPGAR